MGGVMSGCDCLIVGAGPTGLTLAIELKRLGFAVRIVDQLERPAEHSRALVVQARTLELLDRYGLADRAVAQGLPLRGVEIYNENQLQTELHLDRIPSRFAFALVLTQDRTEELLSEQLHSLGVQIERGVTFEGLRQGEGGATEGKGVRARLRRADGGTETVESRWLAGCDGAHSVVRHELGIGFGGETSPLKFELGDLKLVGRSLPNDRMMAHWDKGGQAMLVAPMRGGMHRVFRVTHEDASRDAPPTMEGFNADFERMGLGIRAESAEWLASFHVNERQVEAYSKGDVFLLGDAAHIHSPVGGQGMNTGMQDAANLAWKLAAVAGGAPGRLLNSYNEERLGVGRQVLRGSGLGLRAATTENPLLEGLRNFVIRHLVPLAPMQDAAGRAVSEINIEYRGSEAVVDEGGFGALRAGDRMPDAVRGAGTLLEGMREPGHLMIAVDGRGKAPALSGVRSFEVSTGEAGWSPGLKELLGEGPQIFLVRPDGYIGYRGRGDGEGLRRYAEMVGVEIRDGLPAGPTARSFADGG